jgi:structural maintenance of chromosome 1
VTLRGHIIGKSGAMTGGSSPRDNSDRWEEKEIDVLRKRKIELEQLMNNNNSYLHIRQQLQEVETKFRSCQSKIKLNTTDLKVAYEKLTHLKQQKQLRDENLRRTNTEIISLEKEITILSRNLLVIHTKIQVVEIEIFAEFSKKMGITNIHDYESTSIKRHQEILQKHNAILKQVSALNAQLEYEMKRDFNGVLIRVNQQIVDANKENQILLLQERKLIDEEIVIRGKLKDANTKVHGIKNDKDELQIQLKSIQSRRQEVQNDKEVVSKKLAGVEISIERGRTHLHEILQKAQVDEVALPTVSLKTTTTSSSSGDGNGDGMKDDMDEDIRVGVSSSSSRDNNDDDELHWTGTQTQSVLNRRKQSRKTTSNSSSSGINSSSASNDDADDSIGTGSRNSNSISTDKMSASTHFSQIDNPTVRRDNQTAAKVDLSSTRKKYKNLTKQKIDEIERNLQNTINELQTELESIQPNMHASERYDGILEKLRESNEQLEVIKETARELCSRFDELRKQRQELFYECYNHVSEALGTIYKDLTRSAKHPLGGNAYLTLDNTEEPYLGGIRFTAMPPMKRFR